MADEPLTGVCVGGPLGGQQITARAETFLAVDRAAGKAWLYQLQADGTFAVSTDHDGSLVYPEGAITGERALDPVRAWQAGEVTALDIIAVGD